MEDLNDGTAAFSTEEWEAFCNDDAHLHIVTMISRPGARLFCVKLEYEHYVPGTPDNENFQMAISKWQDMTWAIITIPLDDMDIAKQVAEETGMHIADGIPHSVTADGIVSFPLKTATTYSLENEHDSPIYKGITGQKHVLEFEEAQIQAIFDKYEQDHPEYKGIHDND